MRYSAIAWPLAALVVSVIFVAQDLVFQILDVAHLVGHTAFRIAAWTIAACAMVLLLLPPRRLAYVVGCLVCAGLIAWALYLQHVLDIEPCPLCIFQRVAVIATGVVFLAAALHGPGPRGAAVYAVLTLVTAGIGAGIAAWQVWIQAQPKGAVAACGMGLDYMLETLPLTDVIARVLKGSGECAEQGWMLLGLAIPAWTFVFFVAMLVAAIALTRRD